jgi:uncharacterized protein (DUF1800 family)
MAAIGPMNVRAAPSRPPRYDGPMDSETAVALIRFGLGRRPSEPPPGDPVAWLLRQAEGPGRRPEGPPLAEVLAFLRAPVEERGMRAQAQYRAEAIAHLAEALATPEPFRERLVAFWANHFTVSRRGPPATGAVGHFVREAIRPHVTGRFQDMLLAVIRHPAMLAYLDNAGSIGPGSPVGLRTGRGLNENLAREALELHTVSPAAGYAQADVTEFAKVLTGWSFTPDGFAFLPGRHEPGAKRLLGRSFPPGEEGGIEALAFLAGHPATHRHLAAKLVRHFVADDPPPAAIARIEGVLRDSRGDLGAAARALPRLPEAWRPPLSKVRAPLDYVLAVLRALDAPASAAPRAQGGLSQLGQPLWSAPAPIGWPDSAGEWAQPELLLRRVDWAYAVAGGGAGLDARGLGEQVLGPLLAEATARAAARAGSAREALTLVLTSPEFHRR